MTAPVAVPNADELHALWAQAWPELVPHPRGFAHRLGDPAHLLYRRAPDGTLLAALALRPPEAYAHAHIRLVLVHPQARRQGLGRSLVSEARERLGPVVLALGEERGHFLPAPTAQSVPFFEALGFVRTGRESSDMACDLRLPLPAAVIPAGMRLTNAAEEGTVPPLLAFAEATFGPRWTHDASAVIARDPSQVLVLMNGPQVAGFALTGVETDAAVLPSFFFPEALRHAVGVSGLVGGLGPIGIAPELRGGGVGSAFMVAAMTHLQNRGAQAMAIDWTNVAPFYERLGFREFVRYFHMRG
ncbi:GNAT family N-acetyltransferase [Deinococcus aquatilis]|jgi:GNAT superfamily N-acetyltransferase|uniref:GNAT family N-acetyltransferase n=1 Tax=Deinococcus aquatilis TaxID=519440 RepID=UPI00037C23FD|nr:GNAT family N-acetyltransferase [Deinococcus aquatilis]